MITGPLHDRHVALGATMGAFGGWSMPISYPGGSVAEHTAVRTAVGIFDVSHLGKASVTGRKVGSSKGPKITGFTYKNKSRSRRRFGHRQKYDRVEITGIKKG